MSEKQEFSGCNVRVGAKNAAAIVEEWARLALAYARHNGHTELELRALVWSAPRRCAHGKLADDGCAYCLAFRAP